MLADVMDLLICPHCSADLDLEDRTILCDRGHSFDVARQGYVSLLPGNAGGILGDSAEMIAAREMFLGGGHFTPIRDAVVDAVGRREVVLEVGVGSGYYLAAVLEQTGGRGIGVDVSKAAARRAARAHPGLGSIVADIWNGLPVRSGALGAALCVFSPRNATELQRVIEPGGVLIVVTPTARHQQELIGALGLIGVDDEKARRLGDSLAGKFELASRDVVEFAMELSHADVASLVAMGPSARHTTDASRQASIAALPATTTVTASVVVGVYARLASAAS